MSFNSSLKSMDLLSFETSSQKLSVKPPLMRCGATLRLEHSEKSQLLLVSNAMIQALGMKGGHHYKNKGKHKYSTDVLTCSIEYTSMYYSIIS